jgi:Ricin-type beta-trefoil lectin domain
VTGSDHDPDDRLRVGGWVPSRNDSTSTQQMPTLPAEGPAGAEAAGIEVPDFLQPRDIGPLLPVRVGRQRRGRWWFVVVPVAVAVLAVAVALQFTGGGDKVDPDVPPLSPQALPALSESAPTGGPSQSASASTSRSASTSTSATARQTTTAAGSPPASRGPTTTAPTAHRGAVVGIGGRCLAVDRERVELAVCEDRASQRWSAPGDGTVRALDRCLDVFAAGTANGTPVIVYQCNRGDNQQWQIRADGTWRNPRSNKCLSTFGARSDPGTRLAVFDCAGGAHQRWTLT